MTSASGCSSTWAGKLASVPRRCQMAASGIPTLQDFGQLLPEMTMIMLKRFRKEATCPSTCRSCHRAPAAEESRS